MMCSRALGSREEGRTYLVVLAALVAAAVIVVVLLARRRPPEQPVPEVAAGGQEPAKAAPASPPGVYQVYEDYDRVRSRMLKRRVSEPTLARLDFAAYDSNVLLHDPKDYKPNPPGKKVALAELDFGGSLEKDTLCDRIEQTPLSDEEKAAPMAWLPASEYLLLEWDFDAAAPLAQACATVSEEKWNDPDVVRPYQEVSRIYLHKADGGHEMWARVEFKPWVKFLEGVDDEDADGFPEVYGRLKRSVVPEAAVKELQTSYAGNVLDGQALEDWAYDLGSYWYPQYKTYTLKPEPLEEVQWPDQASRPEFDKVLGDLLKDQKATVVIRGKPFDRFIYLVLYVEGTKGE